MTVDQNGNGGSRSHISLHRSPSWYSAVLGRSRKSLKNDETAQKATNPTGELTLSRLRKENNREPIPEASSYTPYPKLAIESVTEFLVSECDDFGRYPLFTSPTTPKSGSPSHSRRGTIKSRLADVAGEHTYGQAHAISPITRNGATMVREDRLPTARKRAHSSPGGQVTNKDLFLVSPNGPSTYPRLRAGTVPGLIRKRRRISRSIHSAGTRSTSTESHQQPLGISNWHPPNCWEMTDLMSSFPLAPKEGQGDGVQG